MAAVLAAAAMGTVLMRSFFGDEGEKKMGVIDIWLQDKDFFTPQIQISTIDFFSYT